MWNYRQAIGMLTHLQENSRHDIAMTLPHTARFFNVPKLSHNRVVHRISRYSKATRDKGIIYDTSADHDVGHYVDTYFAGGWKKVNSGNPEAILSRTDYVLIHANCPILWCSKLETEISLFTTKCEYVALRESVREVIPFITLLKELIKYFHQYKEISIPLQSV